MGKSTSFRKFNSMSKKNQNQIISITHIFAWFGYAALIIALVTFIQYIELAHDDRAETEKTLKLITELDSLKNDLVLADTACAHGDKVACAERDQIESTLDEKWKTWMIRASAR